MGSEMCIRDRTARGAAMAGAELQDALGGLHWDTLQFHGQHDLAIAEMSR